MFPDTYIETQGGRIINGASIIAMQYIGLSNPSFQQGDTSVLDFVFTMVSGEEISCRITNDQRNTLTQKIKNGKLSYVPVY